MTTAPGKISAIGAGPSVVADAHLDTAAAPLSDLRCRWTAAVTPFDVAVDYMRTHAGSCSSKTQSNGRPSIASLRHRRFSALPCTTRAIAVRPEDRPL
jgi:hypothetical protein